MARRSLQASIQGIQAIKKALKRKQGGQTYLAGVVHCSRQTIWSLLQGNPTDCEVFMDVCKELGLEWEDIAEVEPTEPEQNNNLKLDELVREVRKAIKPIIQGKCGTMQVLYMNEPISLNTLYIQVNILKNLPHQNRVGIEQLSEVCSFEEGYYVGTGTSGEKVPGVEALKKYPKLMVWGGPGAGKTTFLKYLALQCIKTEFQPDCVPFFIDLKFFAAEDGKPGVLEYCEQLLANSEIPVSSEMLSKVFQNGRALVLLDGLDEIQQADFGRVLHQIERFSEQFSRNQFVLTCRFAAHDYKFQQFTNVAIAPFESKHIAEFVHNWFREKPSEVEAECFLQKLEDNSRIRKLANVPLLLTMLCCVFEDSGFRFPINRTELYKDGVDLLLKKWDSTRYVQRDQIYKKLSLKSKEDLLSWVAKLFFESGNYYFKQRDAERLIDQYIQKQKLLDDEQSTLEVNGGDVLKSIEAQHGLLVERAWGIYSFSHLTFQEYFTSRAIVEALDPLAALQTLTTHITDTRWKEVFLMVTELLPNADELLRKMKQAVDGLLEDSDKLQEFLSWVDDKAESVDSIHKPAAIRAFYCAIHTRNTSRAVLRKLALTFNFVFALDLISNNSSNCSPDLDLDLSCERVLMYAKRLAFEPEIFDSSERRYARRNSGELGTYLRCAQTSAKVLNLELQITLERLANELPNDISSANNKNLKHWWKERGKNFHQQIQVMATTRNMERVWEFSREQKILLQQYYIANKLLVDCLNSVYYISREVRQEIEDTLLLPIAEIEKRKNNILTHGG